MAQVKKFNTGGSVQKMKYGSIIKNGTKYEMDEENMKRLEQYIAAADPDIQQSLAHDWKLLTSGQDVTIDTMANRRSTVPTDFSKGQLRRLGKDKATESKWHGAVNSDIHKYNLATQYFGKFDPSKSYKIDETPQKDFWKSNKSIDYKIKDDGTKEYLSLNNTDEKNYYSEITDYLMGDKSFRAQYKDPGIPNFETLDDWFKKLPNPKEFVENLWAKIENGEDLDTNESQFWNAIQMKFGNPTTNPTYEKKVEGDEVAAAKKKAWAAFNVDGVWDDSDMNEDYFVYDPTTGTFAIKAPKLDGSSIGYHFNDDFVANNYGYDHLKGKVNFNGKWYSEKDLYDPKSELYKMLTHKQYDYRNKNLRGEFDAANQVLKTNWSGTKYIPTSNEYLGTFNNDPNYIYENLNYLTDDATYNGIDLGNDWNLLKAINMSGDADLLGRRNPMYILTDAYGRYVNPQGVIQNTPFSVDPKLLKDLYTGQTKRDGSGLNLYHRLSTYENDPYYNTYADDVIFNLDGKTPMIEGWVDINESENNRHMYIDPLYGGIKDTVFSKMPKTVYDLLHDRDFWLTTYNNSGNDTKYRFSQLISTGKNKLNDEDWKNLGIVNDTLKNEIIAYFQNKENQIKRPESFKKGGVVKYQNPSGPVGERKVDDKVKQLSKQMSSPYEAHSFTDGLTETDKIELAAILTDLTGAGLGFLPVGGDIANFGLSTVASTTLGAIADRQRVKQGALPEGSAFWNAVRNIGIDAISLAPVAGDVLNFGNTFKRITNVAPAVISTVLNIPTAVMAPDISKSMITCFSKPGEATMDDWRRCTMGLTTLLGLGKRYQKARQNAKLAHDSKPETGSSTSKYKFEKTDADGKKVSQSLDETDIKALTDAKGQKEIDAAIDQIANKYQLSDSDKAALKLTGPSGMGFKYNKRFLFPDKFNSVETSPIQKDGVGYYMRRPNKRVEAIAGRSSEDLAKTVKDTEWSIHGHNVYKQIKATDPNAKAPDGYVFADGSKKWQGKAVVAKPSVQSNKQGGIIKAKEGDPGLGQHPSTTSTQGWLPLLDAGMSGARILHDIGTNEIITDTKSAGIKDAANAAMLSRQEFDPQRTQLTAGDASKAAANRIGQYLPPVNTDYIKVAAQQRAGFDAKNAMLNQSDREYAAEHRANLDKNTARQQQIAELNMRIDAQNRQTEAQKMAALSELYASKHSANRQSIANYLTEQHTIFKQNRQKVKDAQLASDKIKWTSEANQNYINALKSDPNIMKAYIESKSTLPIEYWVASQPQFKSKIDEIQRKKNEWLANKQLESSLAEVPSWMYKSGGRMRSASDQIAINKEKANDQIKINKYKTFDKNWEDQNKSVRKAIGKMHDRVYNILMKILS